MSGKSTHSNFLTYQIYLENSNGSLVDNVTGQQNDKEDQNIYGTPDYYKKRKNLKSRQQIDQQSTLGLGAHGNQQLKTPSDTSNSKIHQRSFSTRMQSETSVKKAQQRRTTIEESKNQQASKSKNQHSVKKQHNFESTSAFEAQASYTDLKSGQQPVVGGSSNNMNNQESNNKRIKYVKRTPDQQHHLAYNRPGTSHHKQQQIITSHHNNMMDKSSLSISQSVRSLKNTIIHHDDTMTVQTSEISSSFFNNPNTSQHLQSSQITTNTGRVQRLFQKKSQQQDQSFLKSPTSRNNNTGSKQKRSLSKSLSERKLTVKNQMIEQTKFNIIDDLNKTQGVRYGYEDNNHSSIISPTKRHNFVLDQSQMMDKKLVNQTTTAVGMIDGMILMQQETPSSSSNPSRYVADDDDNAFQDFIYEYKSPQKGLSIPNNTITNQLLNNTNTRHDDVNYNSSGGQQQQQQFKDITGSDKIELDIILDFLLNEEEKLNMFSMMVSQGQLLELQSQLPMKFEHQYLDLISSVECKKERPKYFAQQLQVTLIVANALVQVFTPSFLQKYSHKLRNVFTNIHQNFLLLVDIILNCCHANPKENITYITLRKLTMKKLKNKQKSQRLTQFRQSNEVNLLILKKICKSMSGTVNNNSGSTTNLGDQVQQVLSTEYSQLSNEMLEILRIYDKISIISIDQRLQFKDEIIKKKTMLVQSPNKRAKTSQKHGSPKASPRQGMLGNFSPCNSSRSKKSDNSSTKGNKFANKQSPKRGKLVKPTFDYSLSLNTKQKSNKNCVDNDSQYDLVEDYNATSYSAKNKNLDTSNRISTVTNNNNAFNLPETLAFLMSNSVDNELGQAKNANNVSTGNKKSKNSFNSKAVPVRAIQTSGQSLLAQGANSLKPPMAGARQIGASPKQTSSQKAPRQVSTQSGIGTGTKNIPKATQQQMSRQPLSRDTSRLQLDHQLTSKDLSSSDINRLGLSRESSAISTRNIQSIQKNVQGSINTTITNSGVQAVSSPGKKRVVNRPFSRQVSSAKESQLLQVDKRKVSINQVLSPPSAKNITNRPTSRQAQISTTAKSVAKRTNNINFKKDPSLSDFQSEITLNSLNCTPMKANNPKDLTSNIVSSQSHQKQVKQTNTSIAGKKNISLAAANLKLDKKKKMQAVLSSHKTIQGVSSSSSQNNNHTSNSASGVQSRKQVQQPQKVDHTRVMKESQFLKDQHLTLIGFDVSSSNEDDQQQHTMQSQSQQEFYTEQKIKQRNSLLNQGSTVESTTNKSNEKVSGDMDEIFNKGDLRLDKLLNEMVDSQGNQEQNHIAPQTLQFGTLIESNIGSFDLKREMEKLKQMDQEQKMQRRITLKINHNSLNSGLVSGQESETSNTPIHQNLRASQNDSPNKKIFLGEFDETKDDDFGALHLGDDLLISSDSKKHTHQQHQEVAVEVFDFTDYITQRTGMEDPFPDHQDPNEEVSPNNKDTSKNQKVDDQKDQKKKDDEEYQNLRAQVKIPYLPPLDSKEKIYTLVLDLDETLIHLECDDDAQEEDEQVYYLIRPGAIKFLNELSKYYELVIFTAAMPDYADWILDNVDRHRIIKHRLYRQHTTPHEDYAIKDLKNLGRPLERTIIIDNLAENFIHTTPENGIWVESWYDDMDDNVMELLTPFLREIVTNRVEDVRKLLTKSNKEDIIYRCLEEGKDIPQVTEILTGSQVKSPYRKQLEEYMEIE